MNRILSTTCDDTYTYDANGRVLEVDGGSTASYVYNENGQRVRKNTGSTWTEYFYGPNGSVQSEYNGSWPVQYVYAGSRLIAGYAQGTTAFGFTDQLGSTRLVTAVNQSIVDNMDYEPFGQQTAGGSATTHKFTGKERDSESGLDYFGARYYGSSMGRFLSPDPLGGHLEYPQSLNKYVYVMDNPLRFTDPTGLDLWLKGCGKDSATCHKNYEGTWDKNHKHFTRTHIRGDQRQNATLGPHGISVKYGGNTYQGVWDTNKGEQNAVDVAGSGALSPFTAQINGNCGGTCVFSGTLYNASGFGTNQQTLASASAVYSALNAKGSGYVRNAGFDAMDFFHPGDVNFRGYSDTDPDLLFSTHVPVPGPNSPDAASWNGYIHADRTFPYDDVVDFSVHTWSVIRSVVPH